MASPESSETPDASGPESSPPKAPSLLRAAGLIAAVTILSKFLGLIRDWAIMYTYGTSLASDAYFAAFQLPAFAVVLVGGLGGPFHTVTIAIFSRLIKDGEAPGERAKRLASTFITLTGIIGVALSIFAYLFAEPIMSLVLSSDNQPMITLAAEHLRIMSPAILAGSLVGIFYGLLNIYHIFFWPSLSPVAMSVTILAALFLLNPDPSGNTLAWATMAGAFMQLGVQLPQFFKRGFSLKPAMALNSPEVRQLGEMIFPLIIGTTIGQLMTYVDMFFASKLSEQQPGAWAAVMMGNRLIQLPIGVLQTAFLVPIFPRFTRFVVEEQWGELKKFFKTGVIALWLISMPLLVLLLLYTETIIRLLFQYGSFDATSTMLVSQAILFLAFQMIPYFARDSITRVFYAFRDSRTPMLVGLFAIFIKAYLDWLFVIEHQMGVGGITLSTTLVTFMNMTLLGILSKRHIQDLGFKEMLAPFAKIMAAALVMAVIILLLQEGLDAVRFELYLQNTRIIEALRMTLEAMAGLFVYMMIALALKIPEAQYVAERILKRIQPHKQT